MVQINLNGINELDLTLPGTTTATIPSPGVVAVVNSGGGSGYSLGGSLSGSNVVLGAGAGTGATVTVTGLDGSHTVLLTTGTSPAAISSIFTITFTASRGHVAFPVFSVDGHAINTYTALNQLVQAAYSSDLDYSLVSGITPLAAGSTYSWNISCP